MVNFTPYHCRLWLTTINLNWSGSLRDLFCEDQHVLLYGCLVVTRAEMVSKFPKFATHLQRERALKRRKISEPGVPSEKNSSVTVARPKEQQPRVETVLIDVVVDIDPFLPDRQSNRGGENNHLGSRASHGTSGNLCVRQGDIEIMTGVSNDQNSTNPAEILRGEMPKGEQDKSQATSEMQGDQYRILKSQRDANTGISSNSTATPSFSIRDENVITGGLGIGDSPVPNSAQLNRKAQTDKKTGGKRRKKKKRKND